MNFPGNQVREGHIRNVIALSTGRNQSFGWYHTPSPLPELLWVPDANDSGIRGCLYWQVTVPPLPEGGVRLTDSSARCSPVLSMDSPTD